MSLWTVALLYLLVETLARISTSTPNSFDCNDPPDKYTCHGGRYYRTLYYRHWQEAHDMCADHGAQLAIAYSAQDIDTMKKLAGRGGKLETRHCESEL